MNPYTITQENVIAAIRGVFNGIDDEHLYVGIGTGLLMFKGASAALRLGGLQKDGLELAAHLRDPENRYVTSVEVMRDLAGTFMCQFIELFDTQLKSMADGKPVPPGPPEGQPPPPDKPKSFRLQVIPTNLKLLMPTEGSRVFFAVTEQNQLCLVMVAGMLADESIGEDYKAHLEGLGEGREVSTDELQCMVASAAAIRDAGMTPQSVEELLLQLERLSLRKPTEPSATDGTAHAE